MATRNFYLQNADRYFVFPDDDIAIEWNYDCLVEDLTELAKAQGFEALDYEFALRHVEGKSNNSCRDYYGSPLHVMYENSFRDRFGYYWTAWLVPIMRSGYYSGGVIDYFIEINNAFTLPCCNEDALNDKWLKETIEEYLADVSNDEDIQLKDTDAADIYEQVNDLIKELQDKFYELCEASGLQEYILGGTFSNGEAVYLNKTELEEKRNDQKRPEKTRNDQ